MLKVFEYGAFLEKKEFISHDIFYLFFRGNKKDFIERQYFV